MLTLKISGAEIHTRAELYESISRQLPLPDWFGKNLDALHDALTCDILPKEAVAVEITGNAALRDNLGKYADALVGMLNDIAGEDERLALKID